MADEMKELIYSKNEYNDMKKVIYKKPCALIAQARFCEGLGSDAQFYSTYVK